MSLEQRVQPLRLAEDAPADPGTADPRLPDPAPGAPRALRNTIVLAALAAAVVIAALVSAGVGQMQISVPEILASIFHRMGMDWGALPAHPHAESALWAIRFPRVLMAVVVGAALASAGVIMQGVFGNPLAEPSVVGVSAGAAAFACTSIALGLTFFGQWTTVVAAFLGGLVATCLVYLTARHAGRTEVVTLVLTGVAINAIAGAVIALMTFLGDSSAREEIVFWQLGSLNGTLWINVAIAGPIALAGILLACTMTRQLDLLALGERPARHLGVNVESLRRRIIVIVAFLTSAAVAFAGIIGFVGLVVPHILRMALGPGHRLLLPASALGGALLMLAADTAARTLVANADLPIGMLTALVGGPFFFWLIRRTRRGAGGWS
ncbi:FecCD family ABC transporter permease [Glutamicibacter protophormiae]|uniref:FecCD family ABC transporter permease n=1 Tax=Glutamicibacter protophormiae TaxID=37930 RepID=UPI003BB129D7